MTRKTQSLRAAATTEKGDSRTQLLIPFLPRIVHS